MMLINESSIAKISSKSLAMSRVMVGNCSKCKYNRSLERHLGYCHGNVVTVLFLIS